MNKFSSFIFPEKAQFYADRASRCDCDHSDPGGNAAAGTEQGEGKSQVHALSQQHETDRYADGNLYLEL